MVKDSQLLVRLERELLERLKRIAEREDLPVAYVARKALRIFADHDEREQRKKLAQKDDEK